MGTPTEPDVTTRHECKGQVPSRHGGDVCRGKPATALMEASGFPTRDNWQGISLIRLTDDVLRRHETNAHPPLFSRGGLTLPADRTPSSVLVCMQARATVCWRVPCVLSGTWARRPEHTLARSSFSPSSLLGMSYPETFLSLSYQ